MATVKRTGLLALRNVCLPATARTLPLTNSTTPFQRRWASQHPQSKAPLMREDGYKAKPPPYATGEAVGDKRFSQFDLSGKVFVVTGGARGLGLCMAEGLVEAGGHVHCLDILPEPDNAFHAAKERMKPEHGGSMSYHQVDVSQADELEETVSGIADEKQRLDGLIAAAGIQYCCPALSYPPHEIARMLATNYTGVFLSARECARQMYKYKIQGAMCLIASMSGLIANKNFEAPVYNSSKAAVLQLGRNLAMEWGRLKEDGSGGIRVNCLSPGHILTPMVEENFRRGEADRNAWEENSMLGRISKPEEYKAAGLFLLSRASSYMTGQNLVIDGGCTAW